MSNIEWTHETWNPVIGCDKHSAGCANCYAYDIALRLQKQGMKDYEQGFSVRPLPHRLNMPLSWTKPRKVFVNSMSDLFHKDIPFDFLLQIFDVMKHADKHIFQILTKRSDRLRELADKLPWPDNVMMGVTIEKNDYRGRLDDLKSTPVRYKFLSIEPLIGRLEKLDLSGIDWVIVGGESGPRARPMNLDWVREIRDWCVQANVPFWFKQMSSFDADGQPPLLDGKLYRQEPVIKPAKDLFDF